MFTRSVYLASIIHARTLHGRKKELHRMIRGFVQLEYLPVLALPEFVEFSSTFKRSSVEAQRFQYDRQNKSAMQVKLTIFEDLLCQCRPV